METTAYSKRDLTSLLICTCAASIVVPLLSTMLNLALVPIGEEFGVGSHDLGYVSTLYLLGSVVGMVPASRIASIWGMRKVLVIGLVSTAVMCLLMAVSPTFESFILFRFLGGIVSSMMLVTSVASITFVAPAEHRGWALGVNTTAVYLGLSAGPFLGGVVCDLLGWRAVPLFVLAVACVALALSHSFKHEIVLQVGRRMDWAGTAGWGASMMLLMFGVVNVTSAWAWPMIAAGSVVLVLEIRYLLRCDHPVFSVRMFRNKSFSAAAVASFMNYGACYSISYFMALYLQSIGALSGTEAGVLMLIQPVFQVLLTRKAGDLYDRLPDKRTMPAVGAAVTAAGVSMFLFLGTEADLLYVGITLAVCGIGVGLFSSPITAAIMSSVDPPDRGDASGTVSVMRQTGMLVSMGVAMGCVSVVMGSMDGLGPATYGAFVDTIHLAFGICLAMCVAGLLLTLVEGRRDAVRRLT